MEIRESNLKLIASIPGSWDVAAHYLGMTVNALRNRAYEVKGQVLTPYHSLALQDLVEQKHFAQAIASASGGYFVEMPKACVDGREDLSRKFHELYQELGTFSGHFNEFTKDNQIDSDERRQLECDGERLHKVLGEIQALTFRIFCKHRPQDGEKAVQP